MGNLPPNRVTPTRHFIVPCVDYSRPLWIHYKIRSKRPYKVYLAVFVALKMFFTCRVKYQTLRADNATNILGSKNQLKELNQTVFGDNSREEIAETCSGKGIDFQFISPKSTPFWWFMGSCGEFREATIASYPSSASLAHEEGKIIVIEIEAIRNCRPVTPISNVPNDLAALTPGHFLVGET